MCIRDMLYCGYFILNYIGIPHQNILYECSLLKKLKHNSSYQSDVYTNHCQCH